MTTLDLSATWQVQEAKNKFSELLDRACTHGEQIITRHGKAIARVLPFNAVSSEPLPNSGTGADLIHYIRSCPVDLGALVGARDPHDYGRDVDFS